VEKPTFERDINDLLGASQCVAYLHVEFEDGSVRVGTAFWISTTCLFTAGHTLHLQNNIKPIRIRLIEPGIHAVGLQALRDGKYFKVGCTVLGKSPYNVTKWETDVALLYTPNFTWKKSIGLSRELPPIGATVDVIGFPGELSRWSLANREGLTDIDKGFEAAKKLLPEGDLTITRGTVQSVGNLISYKLSTVQGMSGSCVVYQGRAIGEQHLIPSP
jgi:hypothetical protein